MIEHTELAQEIRLLAARTRHLASVFEGEPGRQRGHRWDIAMDIAADLVELAQKIQPLEGKPVTRARKPSEARQVTTVKRINGKRVVTQSPRRSFAICVEGR